MFGSLKEVPKDISNKTLPSPNHHAYGSSIKLVEIDNTEIYFFH